MHGRMAAPIVFDISESPVGPLVLAAQDGALVHIAFEGRVAVEGSWQRAPDVDILRRARRQLDEYFAGERTAFDLPLHPAGTPFQRRVWDGLRRIPHGETTSYADLARRVGNERAVRAVGAANGRNPIVIVVPCHRVIGSDGSLTGFGGGIERKRWLLDHELRARHSRP